MLTTDSAQLQNLIDKDQIRELLFRYAAAVDRKQWSSWQECFTEAARITMPFANHVGRDGLAEWGRAALSTFEVTEHLYGNIQITMTAEGQASGRTNFIAACTHSRSDLNRHFDEGGSYTWEFAKVDDQWLISKLDLDVTWTRGHDDTGLAGQASAAAHAPVPAPAAATDREQILWALDDYAHGIDLQDPEQWLRAWHSDAIFDVDHPKRVCDGHVDLLDWASGVWAQFEVTNHITTNEQITLTSETTATGLGKAVALFVMKDGSYVTAAATYDDKFERRNGVWRLSYRKVDVNHLASHPQAQLVLHPAKNEQASNPLDASIAL